MYIHLKEKKYYNYQQRIAPELRGTQTSLFLIKAQRVFGFSAITRKVAAGWNKFSSMEGSNSIHGLVMKVKPAMGIMGILPKTYVMIPIEIRFGSTAEKDCLNFL